MVFIVVSLRTQKAPRRECSEPMRRRLGLAAFAPSTSKMLAMPNSASPRATSGIMTDSPAVGCTTTFRPALSLSTLATAEADV